MSGTLGLGSFLSGAAGGMSLGMKYQNMKATTKDDTGDQLPQAQQAAQQAPAPQAQPAVMQQPQQQQQQPQQQAGLGLPSNYVQQPQTPALPAQPVQKTGNWSFLDSLLSGGNQ